MLILFLLATLSISQVFADDQVKCKNYTAAPIVNLEVMLGKWYQVCYWTGKAARIEKFTGCLELEFSNISETDLKEAKEKCPEYERGRFDWNLFKVKTDLPFIDGNEITLYGFYNNVTNVLVPCETFSQLKMYSLDEGNQYMLWTHLDVNLETGGEALFAKNLPSHEELECVVKNIDILPDRDDGVFSCHV